VVLIGVLAAGLLAVLRSDLEATARANGGQRALHLADAGAQAASAQLRADADPAHYDADGADNSGWAHAPPDGGRPGETLVLDGGTASVSIRYLLPATTAAQQGGRPVCAGAGPRGSPRLSRQGLLSGRLRRVLRRDAAQGRGDPLLEDGRGCTPGGPVELARSLRVDRPLSGPRTS
jgi:hypothetical protein